MQVSEPSSIIPLSLGAEWVLMAGDLKQLPPTIKTEVARRLLGYDGIALHELGVLEVQLKRQYRMHPAIREFPSRQFYDNQLFEDPACMPSMDVPQPSKHGCGFKWPSEKRGKGEYPIAFFDVQQAAGDPGLEEKVGTSYRNKDEASLVLQLMMAMACDPSVRSIFILTPYKLQADYITKCLVNGRATLDEMRAAGTFHATEVKAHTADGFQGHEADVVIISTVRSSRLGHVQDERRLNVAITRARRALLIVGHARTLKTGSSPKCPSANCWPALLEHIKGHHGYVDGAEVEEYGTLDCALPQEMAPAITPTSVVTAAAAAGPSGGRGGPPIQSTDMGAALLQLGLGAAPGRLWAEMEEREDAIAAGFDEY
ncbi:Regulator of nonsense transcripts 1 [Tetrabaena socialis]|uniref:Regulator of nonsense transcripts 1 n=1 Tax=Tetrabaena socialis TaxID=47790 RepID=A0A2J7ZZL0_9CHLO|nr:Regulator of nonsense transcripts 1 [Tetrabaena socialis]|eukprot:PNH05717.1 Regulator of nonsense transcripts 1 [Tetrabaena socialis]